MVARFTINAVPALAVLGRHADTTASRDDAQKEMWIAFDGPMGGCMASIPSRMCMN